MFCPKCGKEVNDNGRFCPGCGFEIRQNTVPNYTNTQTREIKKKGLPTIAKIAIGVVGVLCVLFVIIGIFGGNSNADNTIQTLKEFTYTDEGNNEYSFEYVGDVDWVIEYKEENDYVIFNDFQPVQCLMNAIGDSEIGSDGSCKYDFSDNQFRIYVDYDAPDGHISIVNYSLDEDKFVLNADGGRYEPSNEFEQDLRNSGIIDAFKYDLNTFKKDLKDNNLSFEDVSSLTYSDF